MKSLFTLVLLPLVAVAALNRQLSKSVCQAAFRFAPIDAAAHTLCLQFDGDLGVMKFNGTIFAGIEDFSVVAGTDLTLNASGVGVTCRFCAIAADLAPDAAGWLAGLLPCAHCLECIITAALEAAPISSTHSMRRYLQ